jgi:hypothetical protein
VQDGQSEASAESARVRLRAAGSATSLQDVGGRRIDHRVDVSPFRMWRACVGGGACVRACGRERACVIDCWLTERSANERYRALCISRPG